MKWSTSTSPRASPTKGFLRPCCGGYWAVMELRRRRQNDWRIAETFFVTAHRRCARRWSVYLQIVPLQQASPSVHPCHAFCCVLYIAERPNFAAESMEFGGLMEKKMNWQQVKQLPVKEVRNKKIQVLSAEGSQTLVIIKSAVGSNALAFSHCYTHLIEHQIGFEIAAKSKPNYCFWFSLFSSMIRSPSWR